MRKSSLPDGAEIVTDYTTLERFVEAFSAGKLNLLLLIGSPGLEKSRMLRQHVPGDSCWIEGNSTAFGMYKKLWYHRDQLVVIDDVDSLYADRAAVRLLKGLCQTDEVKNLAWNSDAKSLAGEGIPREFTTRSRVAIIANNWSTLNVNAAALEDRGHVVVFRPSPLEVHLRASCWFWDQEIFDFIGEHIPFVTEPSLRDYKLAWERKRAGLKWHSMLLSRWLPDEKTRIVAELLSNPDYPTEKARTEEFQRRTGATRATFYNHKRKLTATDSAPHVELTNRPPGDEKSVMELLRDRHGRLGNG